MAAYNNNSETKINGNSNEDKDICHWVNEIFKPQFSFKDLVSDGLLKEDASFQGKYYKEVYRKAILENTESYPTQRYEVNFGIEKAEVTPFVTNKVDNNIYETVCPNKKDEIRARKCNNCNECKYFYKSFEELKRRSVKLLLILESKNIKIDSLKSEKKILHQKIESLENENSKLHQENEYLKMYSQCHDDIYKATEKKMDFYEISIQILKTKLSRLEEELSQKKEVKFKCKNKTTQVSNSNSFLSTTFDSNHGDGSSNAKTKILPRVFLEQEISDLNEKLMQKENELETISKGYSILQQHFYRKSETNSMLDNNLALINIGENSNIPGNKNYLNITNIT